MPDSKRVVTHFHFKFDSGDQKLDEALGTYFVDIRFLNSIKAIWPMIEIRFNADNQVFIEKNVYGKEPIKFKIWWSGDTGEDSGDSLTFELLYLEANLELPAKEEKNQTFENQKESQKRYVVVSFLSKPSYLTMSTFVNRIWEEPTQKTPYDIIKDMLDTYEITDQKRRIIEDGKNEDKVQQMIIPPMTLRASIDYINQNYGIFKGPMFRYSNYAGQFLMWDLRKMYEKHKDSPWFKLHKSPSHFETPGKFKQINDLAIQTEDNFVIYDRCETLHYANANIVRYGYDNIYVCHPHGDIAQFIKNDMETIVNDFGLWHSKPELKYDPDLKNRKIYFSDMKGFETEDGYSGTINKDLLSQDMATCIHDSASMKFVLYRNIKFPKSSKIGEVMYFQPYSDHEKFKQSNYEGAYMVATSDIIFTRMMDGKPGDNINAMAVITAYRTAQSKD